MATGTPLAVLLVENDERDAQAIRPALERGGYAPTIHWVRSQNDYEDAIEMELARRTYDVVICAYQLDEFTARDALEFLQRQGVTLPFVAITRVVDEEVLVDLIRAGASSYLMKARLWALASVVTSALNLRAAQRERQQLEAFLKEYRDELFSADPDMEGIFAGYEREHAKLQELLTQHRQMLPQEH
jgi:DNA-binding NtrC family response regulator